MDTITKYKVCRAYLASAGDINYTPGREYVNNGIAEYFENMISDALRDGWTLHGGVSITYDADGYISLAQAVVK